MQWSCVLQTLCAAAGRLSHALHGDVTAPVAIDAPEVVAPVVAAAFGMVNVMNVISVGNVNLDSSATHGLQEYDTSWFRSIA